MTVLPVDAARVLRDVRVARQGIQDGDGRLVAYQVRFCPSGTPTAVVTEEAVSQVVVLTFGTFGLESISGGRPVLIEMTRPFLTGILSIPVPPEQVVVLVPASVRGDGEVLAGLAALREAGYRVAVADDDADLSRDGMVALADYVLVDLALAREELIPAIVARAGQHGAELIAAGVPDLETQNYCREIGFTLFQGPVGQRPTVLERQVLSPTQLIATRLLKDLADLDVPISRVEQRVAADPGLTMQLLRTANSAGAGSGRQITSLRQALVLIGPRALRSWVVLTLLEGGSAAVHDDALWLVLARAGACRAVVAARSPGTPERADIAFTAGLLSGCAQLLGVETEIVADAAGVAGPTRAALLEAAGEPGRALAAVLAHEHDDEDGIAATGLVPGEVSQAYLYALRDARRLVVELTATS